MKLTELRVVIICLVNYLTISKFFWELFLCIIFSLLILPINRHNFLSIRITSYSINSQLVGLRPSREFYALFRTFDLHLNTYVFWIRFHSFSLAFLSEYPLVGPVPVPRTADATYLGVTVCSDLPRSFWCFRQCQPHTSPVFSDP